MSRILVVTSSAPFVRGGHLVIAEETVAALRRAGHEAQIFETPTNRFGRQFDAYEATRLTDVSEGADGRAIDQIITMRYPAYALRHPRHVVWLTHTMREYYDLWDHVMKGFGRKGKLKETIRRFFIHRLDRRLLTGNVTRLFTISKTVTDRLNHFIGVPSEVLHPPAPDREYRCDGYEPYVFAVSRLHPLKRMDLLIEAMAAMKDKSLRAVIAGEGDDEARLRGLIRDQGLESRVDLVGPLSEQEKLDHFARCRAVYFAPRNEDYGFVTLEAMSSGKAVLTATDSGGPTEQVEHESTGWILKPEAAAFGEVFDRLAGDPALAERLGRNGFGYAARHTWDNVVKTLVLG
ncbi:MAG: glycosyltransferase family 4 protein [Vicinamibacteria bacterium]|jgi:glycosyltransferase involved in cell wall biosynthesis|nr:glycosyltransferase family 4 protein [Vicinamibacteria bacterium]